MRGLVRGDPHELANALGVVERLGRRSSQEDLRDTPEGKWAIGPAEHDGLHQGKNAYKYRLHPVGTGVYTPIPA